MGRKSIFAAIVTGIGVFLASRFAGAKTVAPDTDDQSFDPNFGSGLGFGVGGLREPEKPPGDQSVDAPSSLVTLGEVKKVSGGSFGGGQFYLDPIDGRCYDNRTDRPVPASMCGASESFVTRREPMINTSIRKRLVLA